MAFCPSHHKEENVDAEGSVVCKSTEKLHRRLPAQRRVVKANLNETDWPTTVVQLIQVLLIVGLLITSSPVSSLLTPPRVSSHRIHHARWHATGSEKIDVPALLRRRSGGIGRSQRAKREGSAHSPPGSQDKL